MKPVCLAVLFLSAAAAQALTICDGVFWMDEDVGVEEVVFLADVEDINAIRCQDGGIREPLVHLVARYSPHPEVLEYLLALGADIGALNERDDRVQDYAALNPNGQMYLTVLEHTRSFQELADYERDAVRVFWKNVRSVVEVRQFQVSRVPPYRERASGAASGFVWSEDGYIVTNEHVVEGADFLKVAFYGGGTQHRAEVVGVVPRKDVAVLKIQQLPHSSRPVELGDSDSLLVGQRVMVLGHPVDLEFSISSGVVSALGRTGSFSDGTSIYGMIQTDSATNVGNSGGPLLVSDGSVVGLNTSVMQGEGLAFSVPINDVKRAVTQIIERGGERRFRLGLAVRSRENYAAASGIEKGVVVGEVFAPYGAYAAGIRGVERDPHGGERLGDIVLAIDGREVSTVDDVYAILDDKQPGDAIELTLSREGRTRKVLIPLLSVF